MIEGKGLKLKEAILLDREARHLHLLELISSHKKVLLCGRVNCPGDDKLRKEAKWVFDILVKEVTSAFDWTADYRETWSGADGYAYIILVDSDANIIKRNALKIEANHALGRLFDLDVMNEAGKNLSRRDFSLTERPCIVCTDIALNCMLEKKHTAKEVENAFNDHINAYLND